MKGFRDFMMRGNLVQLAVAFITGAAFNDVVKSFTAMVMSIISKIFGGEPNFNAFTIDGVPVGAFLTSLVSFMLTAAIVYFGIVKPIELFLKKLSKDDKNSAESSKESAEPTELSTLLQIRDLLKTQQGDLATNTEAEA